MRTSLPEAIDLMARGMRRACFHRGARNVETRLPNPSLGIQATARRTLSRIAFSRSYDEPGKPPSSRRHALSCHSHSVAERNRRNLALILDKTAAVARERSRCGTINDLYAQGRRHRVDSVLHAFVMLVFAHSATAMNACCSTEDIGRKAYISDWSDGRGSYLFERCKHQI